MPLDSMLQESTSKHCLLGKRLFYRNTSHWIQHDWPQQLCVDLRAFFQEPDPPPIPPRRPSHPLYEPPAQQVPPAPHESHESEREDSVASDGAEVTLLPTPLPSMSRQVQTRRAFIPNTDDTIVPPALFRFDFQANHAQDQATSKSTEGGDSLERAVAEIISGTPTHRQGGGEDDDRWHVPDVIWEELEHQRELRGPGLASNSFVLANDDQEVEGLDTSSVQAAAAVILGTSPKKVS